MSTEKRFCVDCRHHGANTITGQHFCQNRAIAVSPVTGLGYCSELNAHGQCEGYEPKPQFMVTSDEVRPGAIEYIRQLFSWRRS